MCLLYCTVKSLICDAPNPKMFLISYCSCLCAIYCNLLKPGVKSRMKMCLAQHPKVMLHLHLSYWQCYCLLKCLLYQRFEGSYIISRFMWLTYAYSSRSFYYLMLQQLYHCSNVNIVIQRNMGKIDQCLHTTKHNKVQIMWLVLLCMRSLVHWSQSMNIYWLIDWTLVNKFQWHLNSNTTIVIQKNLLKIPFAKYHNGSHSVQG